MEKLRKVQKKQHGGEKIKDAKKLDWKIMEHIKLFEIWEVVNLEKVQKFVLIHVVVKRRERTDWICDTCKRTRWETAKIEW